MSRIAWIDATGGVSGDMLLGACLDAGADIAPIRWAIDALGLPEPVSLGSEPTSRAGLGATRALVQVGESHHHRRLVDVLALLGRAAPRVADRAGAVFRALAAAEAHVHGASIDDVHFHEVGALDSIADVVGVVVALDELGADRLVCSPIALGGGRVSTQHGPIPVPGPAVVELLRAAGAPAFGGPIDVELATPTGVALMTTLADSFGPLPSLTPHAVGVGAGGRDPDGHANITRLVIGEATTAGGAAEPGVVLEANVDDLDPRLWPDVLAVLLAAGASDAWLTPILMKKGRPAHTLSVLCPPHLVAPLQRLVFTHTSTIGLRRRPVEKVVLEREFVTVEVLGGSVRIKIARMDGEVVNAVPEYDDVAALAAERELPVTVVLDAARSAADPAFAAGIVRNGPRS